MDLNSVLQPVWTWIVEFLNRLLPDYIIPNLWLIFEVVSILIVAYIVGKTGKFITTRFLRLIGLKRITSKSWAESVLRVTGYKGSVVELLGDLVKWLIYILFFAFILQLVGLSGVADLFGQIAIFVPRFIGAILLIVVGFIIADFFGKVFEEAGSKFMGDESLGKLSGGIIRYSVGMIVLIMSLALVGLDITALAILLSALLVIVIIITGISIKDVLPDLMAGMRLRNLLRPGDHVKVSGYEGVVERLEPLVTRLHKNRSVVLIPNSMVTKAAIEKKNRKNG